MPYFCRLDPFQWVSRSHQPARWQPTIWDAIYSHLHELEMKAHENAKFISFTDNGKCTSHLTSRPTILPMKPCRWNGQELHTCRSVEIDLKTDYIASLIGVFLSLTKNDFEEYPRRTLPLDLGMGTQCSMGVCRGGL